MNIDWLYREVGLRIIDLARRTPTLDILRRLKRTEYISADALREIQLTQLRKLLAHCAQNVPYYQDVFKEYHFDPGAVRSVDDLHGLPILTKSDIRKNFSRLIARNWKAFKPRPKETGGSTGEPLRMYHDSRSHGALWANIYRGFGYGGYRLGEKYLTLASGSLAPKKLKAGRWFYFRLQNSIPFPSYQLQKGAFHELLEVLRRERPKYIYGYSSSLAGCAIVFLREGIRVEGMQAVFTTADMLYPKQRRMIEEAFGATVFDNYGCPEAGLMSWECDQHDGYHYNIESCLIEILDQNENGVGRVIATNLFNFAFPIVRYDTGDVATLGGEERCKCGRSHRKVKALLGRQRDIITLPSGRMIHGAFFNHLPDFYNSGKVARFQIVQPELRQLEVHLEMQLGFDISDMEYLPNKLQKLLGDGIAVTVVQGEFRESPYSRKHRSVISDVDNMWTRE